MRRPLLARALCAAALASPLPLRAQDAPAQVAEPAEPAAAPAPAEAPAEAPPAAPDPSPAPPPPPPPAQPGAYGGQSPSRGEAEYDRGGEPETDDYGDPAPPREFSIRLDPFNWLIEGRLGVELELGVWEMLSVELVPQFVTTGEPPAFNFAGRDDPLTQSSNGLGPISGASLGVGVWLSGEPFSGYVLRAILTNYNFTYEASDAAGVFDRVHFAERRFVFFFGSHSRWGPFTIAGGLGLGYELNQQERCDPIDTDPSAELHLQGRRVDCDGENQIALDRRVTAVADLNGSLHPVYLEARFSLGFVF